MSAHGTVALSVPHDGAVAAVAFSPDSSRVATGGDGSTIKVSAVETGAVVELPARGFVTCLAFSPDGAALAVADLDQVVVRDATSGAVVWQDAVEQDNQVNTVVFGPDGKSLIAVTDTLIASFDAASGAPGHRFGVDPTIAAADLSGDGGRIAVAIDERRGGNHRFAGSARVLDVATGAERSRLTPDNAVFDVAFSPDGETVLCSSADGTTRLFAAENGEDERWKTGPESGQVAFSPTGLWVIVGGAWGTAQVLEAESGNEWLPPVEHDGAVTHVAFAPNGRWAASAGIDAVLHVFDVYTGADHYTRTNTDEVHAMGFSPDSRWLGLGHLGSAIVVDNGS